MVDEGVRPLPFPRGRHLADYGGHEHLVGQFFRVDEPQEYFLKRCEEVPDWWRLPIGPATITLRVVRTSELTKPGRMYYWHPSDAGRVVGAPVVNNPTAPFCCIDEFLEKDVPPGCLCYAVEHGPWKAKVGT